MDSIAPWLAASVAFALGAAALVSAVIPPLRVSHIELAQNLKQ